MPRHDDPTSPDDRIMSMDNIEEESPKPQKSSNMMNLLSKGIKQNYDKTKEEYDKAMAKEAE